MFCRFICRVGTTLGTGNVSDFVPFEMSLKGPGRVGVIRLAGEMWIVDACIMMRLWSISAGVAKWQTQRT